jgi:hypothetical protein
LRRNAVSNSEEKDMAEQNPDPRRGRSKKRGAAKRAKTLEFVERLDQIAKGHPASRLLVDMAQDAGMEIFRKQAAQLRRLWHELGKMRQKRDGVRDRLMSLVHAITTTPPLLPRIAGRPAVAHDELRQTFAQLQSRDFPDLALLLHDRIGRSDVARYQRFLVDEILIKGSRMLLEYLIHHVSEASSAEVETSFLGRLRDHIAGSLCHMLAKKAGYQMTPDAGKRRDALIDRSLAWLADLLTATPPGRLIAPLSGSPFDPARHEPTAGRPSEGELKVTAMLFPGYLVCGEVPAVAEKAMVFTAKAGES